MIRFDESLPEDLPQIQEWTAADPYHLHQGQPEWWLTGNGLLSFTLMDERGPLCYVRLDEEGEYVRIHIQFAPETVVSKRRLLVGLVQGFEAIYKLYRSTKKGLITNSVSPRLIAFLETQLKFKPVGNDDYRVDYEVS